MKVTGAEFREWLDTGWLGDDWYIDGGEIEWEDESGKWVLDDAAKYETDEFGGVFFHGHGEDPTDGQGYDIGALIRKWRKARTHTTFVVTVPNERIDDFKSAMKAMGLKVNA